MFNKTKSRQFVNVGWKTKLEYKWNDYSMNNWLKWRSIFIFFKFRIYCGSEHFVNTSRLTSCYHILYKRLFFWSQSHRVTSCLSISELWMYFLMFTPLQGSVFGSMLDVSPGQCVELNRHSVISLSMFCCFQQNVCKL